jgi:heterodisulfide reductase subunit D
MAELEKYRNNVNRCIRCGICRAKYDHFEKVYRVCPSGEHTAGFWTNFPSGRVAVAKEILDGNLELKDVPVQHVFECLLCGNCRQTCGAQDLSAGGAPLINHPHIVKALRAELFDSGVELPEAVGMFCNAIEKSQNVMGYPNEERADWVTDNIKLDPTADTIYFVGCLSSFREIEIAQATAKVLNILGVPFNILGNEEHCCGNPMLMMGNLFLARDLMRHNCELMKGKKVIASCAGCYRILSQDYPKVLGEECKINARHIVQVLAEQIEQGKVKFTKKLKKKVVYHDPCELGRDMQVFDEPRKILAAIPGLEVVEFVRTREKTWCCGGGGGVKGMNFDLAVEIATDKVEQANEVGAEVVVSACPSCKRNIIDGIKSVGSDLDTLDILELVIEAGITKA